MEFEIDEVVFGILEIEVVIEFFGLLDSIFDLLVGLVDIKEVRGKSSETFYLVLEVKGSKEAEVVVVRKDKGR